MSYDILEKQKTPLKALKIKSFKYKKIHIFTTAKPMVLVKKRAIFQAFPLSNKAQENVLYDILEQKKRRSRLEKQEVQASKK